MSHNITVVFLIISWLVYILFISFISLLIFDDEMPYWNLIWMIWTYGGREHPTSMQDVLQSAKAETAQVKRIVLSCERDMEAQKGMKNTPRNHGLGREFTLTCIIILHVIALFGTIYGMFDIRGWD